MKVIGTTGDGVLVETTLDEMAKAIGFTGIYSEEWRRFKGNHPAFDRNGNLVIGATLEVARAHGFLQELQRREKQVRDAAGLMHSLADMVTHALPTFVVAPVGEKPAEE